MDKINQINKITKSQNELFSYLKNYEENNLQEFWWDLYLSKDSFKQWLLDKVSKFENIVGFYSYLDNIKKNKEKLIICWDYDADWICSTVLFSDFCDLNNIDYEIFIPNRVEDGYWLNELNIHKLSNFGLWDDTKVKNVICLDNWVNQVWIKKILDDLGINFFIIDHHQEDEKLIDEWINQSKFQLNPHLKENLWKILVNESNISTWMLALMIWYWYFKYKWEDVLSEEFINKWYDMALISTITDMMPMTWINRWLIKNYKNELLKPWNRKSLNLIIWEALQSNKISFDQEDNTSNDIVRFIWWQLWPIINSFWRISNGDIIYDLLKTWDFELWKIYEMNDYRKKITWTYRRKIEDNHLDNLKNKSSYFLYKFWSDSDYAQWILSILSWTISNWYNKIVWIWYEEEGSIRYSFRSPNWFNLKKLFKASNFEYKWHKEAWVIKISKDEELGLNNFLSEVPIFKENTTKFTKLNLPIKLTPSLINTKTINILDYYWPFWIWNPQPKFIVKWVLLKQKTNLNNWYISYTEQWYEKIKLLVGNKEIMMYNFWWRLSVDDIFKARGFLWTLEKPFNEYSNIPVFIINKIINEKK